MASLRDALGTAYDVRYPAMPKEDNPSYAAWKAQIGNELAPMSGARLLAGHSLGASMLLKYMADVQPRQPVAGLFLVACPFWKAEDWQVEYALPNDSAARLPSGLPIFFYHSRDDEVVPFAHHALYQQLLPQATFRVVVGRDHQFNNDLSEVARDIRTMMERATSDAASEF